MYWLVKHQAIILFNDFLFCHLYLIFTAAPVGSNHNFFDKIPDIGVTTALNKYVPRIRVFVRHFRTFENLFAVIDQTLRA